MMIMQLDYTQATKIVQPCVAPFEKSFILSSMTAEILAISKVLGQHYIFQATQHAI